VAVGSLLAAALVADGTPSTRYGGHCLD